jgi:hypothetical protein
VLLSGLNPFLSVPIGSYPFRLEPSVSVVIRLKAWDKNGTRRFQRERIRTDTNREKRIGSVLLSGLNPFLSVHIGSYPFELEPPVSVVIRRKKHGIKTEPDGSSVNGYKQTPTERNGLAPCYSPD